MKTQVPTKLGELHSTYLFLRKNLQSCGVDARAPILEQVIEVLTDASWGFTQTRFPSSNWTSVVFLEALHQNIGLRSGSAWLLQFLWMWFSAITGKGVSDFTALRALFGDYGREKILWPCIPWTLTQESILGEREWYSLAIKADELFRFPTIHNSESQALWDRYAEQQNMRGFLSIRRQTSTRSTGPNVVKCRTWVSNGPVLLLIHPRIA